MDLSLIIGVLVVLIILAILIKNVRVVPNTECYIIERLGKYHATWEAGIHVKLPIFDNIINKVSMKEQVLDFKPQNVITKDNVTMSIDSVVFMKVFDAKLFTYGVNDAIFGLQNINATTLRNIVGSLDFDQTLTSRDTINAQMETALDEATDPWGIKVNRVEIKNISPPAEIEEVMTKQMKAEREKRQAILEAEAHQQSVIARAEGDKKAKVLAAEAERDAQIALAEGKAKSIKLVYDAEAEGLNKLSQSHVTESVLKLKGIQALKDVADGNATKIFMPSDISQIVTSLGVVGESLGIGDSTKINKKVVKEEENIDPCLNEESSYISYDAKKTLDAIQEEVEPE